MTALEELTALGTKPGTMDEERSSANSRVWPQGWS